MGAGATDNRDLARVREAKATDAKEDDGFDEADFEKWCLEGSRADFSEYVRDVEPVEAELREFFDTNPEVHEHYRQRAEENRSR